MKLKAKFVLLLIVTMFILLGGMYAGLESQRQEVLQQEQRETTETATIVATRLDYQISEKRRNIRLGANNPSMRAFGTETQRRAVERFHARTDFDTVAVLNRNGTKVVFEGVSNETETELVGEDYSDRPYVKNGLNGSVYVTDPFVADTGKTIAVVSAPLYENGTVVGVIGGSIVLNDEAFFASVRRYDTGRQSVRIDDGNRGVLYSEGRTFENPIRATATVESTGWTVEVRRTRTPVATQPDSVETLFRELLLAVVVLFVFGGFGGWIYQTNLKQADRLVSGFDALEAGRYDHDPDLGGSEEWTYIDRSFQNLQSALAERERELTAERDRFATLFENVSDPAVMYTIAEATPVIERVNSAFATTFGSTDTAGDSLAAHLEAVDGDVAEIVEALPDGAASRREFRLRTADGVGDFLLRNATFEGGEGQPGGCLICTDITDQKRRQRELERQNDRLDRFASAVSHDLRNPLSIAQTRLDLLRNDDDGDDHIEYLESSLERMEALIDDILTLSRQGRAVGSPARISLSDPIERAWYGVDTAEATLSVSDEAALDADPERLRTLFENLFRNAIEHGGSDVSIEVGTLSDGFYVADDGHGIPPKKRDTAFEYGFTTADEGTGFGLAIVETIAEAHGWSVTIEESETGGARFEICGVDSLA